MQVNSRNGNSPLDLSRVEFLAKGGRKPSDVKRVFISHLHIDYVGHSSLFPLPDVAVFRRRGEPSHRRRHVPHEPELDHSRRRGPRGPHDVPRPRSMASARTLPPTRSTSTATAAYTWSTRATDTLPDVSTSLPARLRTGAGCSSPGIAPTTACWDGEDGVAPPLWLRAC